MTEKKKGLLSLFILERLFRLLTKKEEKDYLFFILIATVQRNQPLYSNNQKTKKKLNYNNRKANTQKLTHIDLCRRLTKYKYIYIINIHGISQPHPYIYIYIHTESLLQHDTINHEMETFFNEK